jgi:glycosyltransferase involved in cell wall biosynthesis
LPWFRGRGAPRKTRIVPLYASSWVNPEVFRPDPAGGPRDIDLLMVANFAPVKRHFALFQALRRMPQSLRIVLVGQPDRGYTAGHLLRLAAAYGVASRFELLESLPHDQVAALFRRSRTSAVLSRREGSSLTVVESLLSDTPAAVMRDAVIGSKAYINPKTGRLLDYQDLGGQLTDFIEHAGEYSPREWAMGSTANCFRATEVLNGALREAELAEGRPWTRDIAVHYWDPDPILFDEADRGRLEADRARIREEFGVLIGR